MDLFLIAQLTLICRISISMCSSKQFALFQSFILLSHCIYDLVNIVFLNVFSDHFLRSLRVFGWCRVVDLGKTLLLRYIRDIRDINRLCYIRDINML